MVGMPCALGYGKTHPQPLPQAGGEQINLGRDWGTPPNPRQGRAPAPPSPQGQAEIWGPKPPTGESPCTTCLDEKVRQGSTTIGQAGEERARYLYPNWVL